jgi:hypothetical protein
MTSHYQQPTVPKPPDVTVCIGVDIGQRVDPTAIVVAEQQRREDGATHFLIRHLERLPLGTGYPLVAARVVEVVTNAVRHLRTARYSDGSDGLPAGFILSNGWEFQIDVFLTIDSTGVGRPVCELVIDALDAADLRALKASLSTELATFTYGERITSNGEELRVGKAFLVSRLQAQLHTNRIHLPMTSEAYALANELMHYEIKVDPDGDAKFGAFKTGTHDDMVTALGLATLLERRRAVSGRICRNGHWWCTRSPGDCDRLAAEHRSANVRW